MQKLGLHRNQKGFTLVEIAIVMVIIGLLIGGILKGQEMINNAKVKRVVKQADEMRAAVMTFYDKYGQYPGDENSDLFPPGDTINGNNNGQILGPLGEACGAMRDLALANLISGTYNGTSDLPPNAFGGTTRVAWVDPGPGVARHCIQYTNMPPEVCQEIDVKYDDGVWNTGSIAGSAVYTAGGAMIANFYIVF